MTHDEPERKPWHLYEDEDGNLTMYIIGTPEITAYIQRQLDNARAVRGDVIFTQRGTEFEQTHKEVG